MNQNNQRFIVKLTNGQTVLPNCSPFELKQFIYTQETQVHAEHILIINNQNKVMTKAQLLQLQRLQTASQKQGDISLSIMNAQSLYDQYIALKDIKIKQEEKIINLENSLHQIGAALNQQKIKVLEVENEKQDRLESIIIKAKNQQTEFEQLREHYEEELINLNNEYKAKILFIEQKLKYAENQMQQAELSIKEKDQQIKNILIENDRLQNSFFELDTKNTQLLKENEQLTQKIQQYTVYYTQLYNQFQAYQVQANDYIQQVQIKMEQDYQKYTNELEEQTQQKRKAVLEITEERNWVKKKAAEYEEKYTAQKRQFDKLQLSNTESNKTIEQLKINIDEYQSKLNQLNLLTFQLESKEKEIKKLKEQINQLKPKQF